MHFLDFNLDQVLIELREYGYSHIPGYLSQNEVGNLLKTVENAYANINLNGKVLYGGTPSRDQEDKIIYNIFNYGSIFLEILTRPLLRAVAMKMLNDPYYRFLPPEVPNYNLLYYNARSSGQSLDLHIDSHIPFVGERTSMLQAVILLEKSSEENGCTIVVPGTHRSGKFSDRTISKVVNLAGEPGDLLIWDSRLWHGTRENKVKRSRWALVATLGMWWVKPMMDIPRIVSDEIFEESSKEVKQLLGFCSIVPTDPKVTINTKSGYEDIKVSKRDYGF